MNIHNHAHNDIVAFIAKSSSVCIWFALPSHFYIDLQANRYIDSLWSSPPPAFLIPALSNSGRSLSTTASLATTIKRTKIRVQNPVDAYKLRQAQARKDANISRQAVLREQRQKELGDPIRGITTPFVESFDTIVPQGLALDADAVNLEPLKTKPDQPPPSPAHASDEIHLNHGMSHDELRRSLEFSCSLTEPTQHEQPSLTSESGGAKQRQRWEARHSIASEAVQRIVSLASGSSKQRTKKNIERIVDAFGRHNTDHTLKPKAPAAVTYKPYTPIPRPTPRVGPDTGSSEVQIGILTVKIRVLADRYEGPNRNDKINKRNLRLLLHRRQKLLSYMERKERGSERWQNLIGTLGLTPACWKGQIAVQ
ncbi:small subunit ribosomal protein S15, partial [Lecanoromycetidae sp. Uapishka_2]